MTYGTSYFFNFTKACDYYRNYFDDLTPAELEKIVRGKIDDGEIGIGKPDVPINCRLVLIDDGCRYALEER